MSIICALCNKTIKKTAMPAHLRTMHHKMHSQDYYDTYLKKEGEGLCLTCGKPTKYQTLFKGYKLYCADPKCSQQSPEMKQQIKKIRLQKNDGVWNINYKEKRAKTCQAKYGEDVNNLSKTKAKRQRARELNDSSEKQRIAYHKTCLERYGKNPNGLEEVKQKKENTCLEHYGVKNPAQTGTNRNKSSDRMKRGGAIRALSFVKSPSKPQISLFNLVKSLHREAILNFPIQIKVNKGYSIDIAIPDLMMAIEYDGSYWHQNSEQDAKRQKEIEALGWKFLRYKDRLPNLEDLQKDIMYELENKKPEE